MTAISPVAEPSGPSLELPGLSAFQIAPSPILVLDFSWQMFFVQLTAGAHGVQGHQVLPEIASSLAEVPL